MKALVIGGNRFFGKRLVDHLLKLHDNEVWVLNRGHLPTREDARLTHLRADRTDPAALRKAIGNQSWDIIYDQACYDAQQAREACEIFGDRTSTYIFTSSQSVYPQGLRLTEAIFKPETYKYEKPVNTQQDYAEAKRQAESVFFTEGKFSVIAVRFPIVLGEDDYTGRLDFHIERVARQKVIFLPNPSARISFIRSRDAAGLLNFLSTCQYHGPLNAASTEPVELLRLLELIERTVGKPAKLSEKAGVGDQSPFGIAVDWAMDTRALQRLGYKPAPIVEWLPELVEKRWKAMQAKK
jgi:nucleoside-diphosphate-sugar epimerase